MQTSKISIIVPIYNAERFLDKCIGSIINQTYSNLEIILINDGSSDNSLSICKSYAEADRRIIVIDKENGGVASARNIGLDRATGDYIGFVDSDDFISLDMYKILIKAILKNDADIAECSHYVCSEDYKTINEIPLKNRLTIGVDNCLYDYLNKINTENFNWNKLYKWNIVKSIRYSNYRYSEDYVFNVRAFAKCRRKITINKCCYYYVINLNSATQQLFNINKLDSLKAGSEILSFLKRTKLEYSKYATLYILNYIRKFYFQVMKLETENKEEIKRYLKDEYTFYYKNVERELKNITRHKKTYIALWLFSKNPILYYYLERLRKRHR